MATNIEGNTLESWTVYSGNPKTGNTSATVTTTSSTYANAMLNSVTTSTSTGNVAVDFVWKNHALQPNDVRTATTVASVSAADSTVYPGYIQFTTSAAHGFTQGQNVSISGIPEKVIGAVGSLGNPINFTQANIDSVPSSTTFTIQSNLPASLTGLSATATTVSETTYTYGGTDNAQWTSASTLASMDLDFTKGYHEIIESNYSGYPSFTAGSAKLMVTAAKGDGTTVTYTAQSIGTVPASLVGQNVSITGCSTSAFNLSNVTIASATAYQFTVTNSAGSGVSITGQNAIAQLGAGASDSDGAYVSGAPFVTVPNVIGLTTANAQAVLAAGEFTVTTASGVTPAISNVALTSNVATITTAAAHGFAVGDLVTVAAVTATTVNATLVAIATVPTTTTFTYAKTATNVVSAADTGTVKVPARFSTIKTQSVAAGTASKAIGAAITITPYAAS